MNGEQYKSKLREKIAVLQRVNENLLQQHKAIASKDTILLGKLLKRQQKNIDRLNHIDRLLYDEPESDRDVDYKEYEAVIETMLKDAIQTVDFNITTAEGFKNIIGESLCRLKINGNALKNSYFSKGMQQFGYFIDKRK